MTSIFCKRKKTIALFFYLLSPAQWALPFTAGTVGGNSSQYYKSLPAENQQWADFMLNSLNGHEAPFFSGDVGPRAPGISPGRLPFRINAKGIGGPTQPEMQQFQSVNANNMVDLFSGDFSYNIPLMDVGGYPINISYRSGISMDQEASWVGLGWNVNPGTISRSMRGLPDDFNGSDSIKKVTSIKQNKTIGVTAGADIELTGLPLDVGASLGVFHNNYKGWGLENGINASINSGADSKGPLTGGLSLSNNSQEGLTITPSLSISLGQDETESGGGYGASFSLSAPYNSRAGLKGLQLSTGVREFNTNEKNQLMSYNGGVSSFISFFGPTATPSITTQLTSSQYSFTAKVGLEAETFHPSFYVSGYVSKQYISPPDTLLTLPAYGYLHFQGANKDPLGLLDFNHEKDMIYRDNPAVPNIGVPYYTYDAFSITGEGTGGMFRAYRGDIGQVHGHLMRTKDLSGRASIDLGIPSLVHGGVDLNVTRAYTQDGAWASENSMRDAIAFKDNDSSFEAAYFRNPGEKSVSSKQFYDSLGGDDVVTTALFQPGTSSSSIQATNYLTRYHNSQAVGKVLMTPHSAVRPQRDKRSQAIYYLNAQEADVAGLSKYIENYTLNQFALNSCTTNVTDSVYGDGGGLPGLYYSNKNMSGVPDTSRIDPMIDFTKWYAGSPITGVIPADNFSISWQGRLKAPSTGSYVFATVSDDGSRLWLGDSLIVNDWHDHAAKKVSSKKLNLVAGQLYDIKMTYYEHGGDASVQLLWTPPGQTTLVPIPMVNLFKQVDSIRVNSNLVLEKRVNQFRKPNHISQIDVLNSDGRRYVYGLPVYNLRQKETTFAVNGSAKGNLGTGLVGYSNGIDNTTQNQNGKDNYFNSEEIPAYAHSFLLTGILSPDYVDLTGDGITDDDLGDAVKFDYSKVCGLGNPFRWRAPYVGDSVTFNPGLRTDSRDDKGNYVYGEKELWYLHSIESKTMIATFIVENRADLYAIDEAGHKHADSTSKRLKEIDLYNKADYLTSSSTAIPVKVVHFEYDYELCLGVNQPLTDSGKLTLKKIWFTYNGNDKGKQNPYIFSYHPNNPSYRINAYDRWGNYKDPLQNPGSTTANLITNADYPYAVQDSTTAAYNAGAWALDSVHLPSGGSIKVDYESDDYAYVQNLRAMQMFKLLGLSVDSVYSHAGNQLYSNTNGDCLYAFVSVPTSVSSKTDAFQKYLTGISKLFFRLFVRMPDDIWGTGSEYIPCYATLDTTRYGYGRVSNNVIWVKIMGISLAGDAPGSYSPLAKAAIQFLRLNLPSKAYPGSEVGDNIDLTAAVKMIFSLADNIKTAFSNFDLTARGNSWAYQIDTSRTLVRLDCPIYRKFGGGHRVKRVTIYDNWDKMAGQRRATYGQQYTYTDQEEINGLMTTISSGVASYEPGIGGEENPFRQPIEYTEGTSVLGPTTMGYTEEPLGESLFPSPGVGYSRVRVRTINYKNIKSANGYDETRFYTARDFPTLTDRSLLDNDTKKRYDPPIAKFLRINARYFLTMSQGFKVELNDMHGKLRSQASYPETDTSNPVTYTENIYRVVDPNADNKVLSNTVIAMAPDGTIDTSAIIGKDVELMMDMREEESVTNGNNLSLNLDLFEVPFIPPLFAIPSFINLAQREENRFRSTATMKVIQRYGILDSVIHIDKGSKVSTKDLMYDSETGDVLLTRTQNEFNDPVYTFHYPSYWAYDGMGPAYKNIDLILNHIYLKNGKIYTGMTVPDSTLFSSGDEILVVGKQKTGDSSACVSYLASFPSFNKIWAVDTSTVNGGRKSFYFIDAAGNPYSANDVTMKVIRSGRRNMMGPAGSVTTLAYPLVMDTVSHQYNLVLNTASKVLSAASSEFRQYWKVEDRKGQKTTISCADSLPADCSSDTCNYSCLKNLFDYLVASKRLFTSVYDNVTVAQMVQSADSAGYSININNCALLSRNSNKLFYAMTTNDVDTLYRAAIGTCIVEWKSLTGKPVPFYTMHRKAGTTGAIYYDTYNGTGSPTYQITQTQTYGDVQPAGSDVLLSNKVVVACGNIKGAWVSFSSADTASVMIFDKTGANLWSKNLGIPYSKSGFVKALSDSGFILLGSIQTNSSPVVHSIFIIRFDKSYNITWAKNYSFNIGGSPQAHDDLVPADFLALTDGSFIVSGVKPPLSDGNGYIFKISSSGSLLWSHEYNRSTNNSDAMGPMIQNGDTLISVGNGINHISKNQYDLFLSKINLSSGAILDTITYHVGDTSEYDWPIHLYKTMDNSGYYLTYFTSNGSSPVSTDTTLIYGALKIDNNLNAINAYNFDYTGVDKHLTSALVSQDGGLVITMKDPATNSSGSFMHKIDFEGDSTIWTKHYQNADTIGQLYAISELSDLSLFASGEKLKSDGKGEIFIMHTDASGNLPDGNCNLSDSGVSLMLDTAAILLCSNFSDHSCGTWDTTSMEGPGVVATQSLSVSAITAVPAYSCGYYNDTTTIAMLHVTTCHFCDTMTDYTCKSLVTDTLFNPYVAGSLGNWRAYKNYSYFGPRTESDPTAATNIRTNGTFYSFAPFWAFSSNGLQPQYDTSRWAWNSQITLFSKKGLEIENMDPLGRYNSGLYGYNLSLPTAVIQNGHYRESGFEGFEDYGFLTQGCDTSCPTARHLDFTPFISKMTSSQKHTGMYSLQLGHNDDAGLTFALVTPAKDSAKAKLAVTTFYDTCTATTGLTSLKTSDSILLPAFSPFIGKRMVVSAWVKESQACNCAAYSHNQILVTFNGSSTSPVTFVPGGNIIEGWQRYEGVFTIPFDATSLSIDLKSTDTFNVYFDDVRLHPFSANMKSFVYNPVNLRLMAELDENNYATFYEYDDDGTLIRVKKETERGIMTIKETRSALLKQ